MSFVNETSWIGLAIIGLTNITGSLFLSLLFIFIALYIICMAVGIPPEASGIVLLPILIMSVVYSGELLSVFAIFLIYLAVAYVRAIIIQN